eukprot:scaffold101392_cov67-Phaeocystis_antarctica.AAC.1
MCCAAACDTRSASVSFVDIWLLQQTRVTLMRGTARLSPVPGPGPTVISSYYQRTHAGSFSSDHPVTTLARHVFSSARHYPVTLSSPRLYPVTFPSARHYPVTFSSYPTLRTLASNEAYSSVIDSAVT